jgi:hypothetical protein
MTEVSRRAFLAAGSVLLAHDTALCSGTSADAGDDRVGRHGHPWQTHPFHCRLAPIALIANQYRATHPIAVAPPGMNVCR